MKPEAGARPETAVELIRRTGRVRPSGRDDSLLVGALPVGEEARRTVRDGFSGWMQSRFPAWGEDDLENEVSVLFGRATDLGDWYRETLGFHGITIEFWDRRPYVDTVDPAAWARLTRRIDPDALITLSLVQRGRPREVLDLTRWGTYATPYHADLRRLTDRGLADTHIHLGGCDSVPLFWNQVMAWYDGAGEAPETGRRRLGHAERYAPRALAELEEQSPEDWRRRLEEKALIKDAAEIRRLLLPFALRWQDPTRGERACLEPAPELWEERIFLTWAWYQVQLESEGRPSPLAVFPSDFLTQLGDRSVIALLDRYLYAKNLFLEVHYIGPEGNPGLRRFRRLLDQLDRPDRPRSRRFHIADTEERIRFATEPEALEKIEFRLSPKNSGGEWRRFLSIWDEAVNMLRPSRRLRKNIGIVVHFIRPTRRQEVSGATIPHEMIRRKVAHQSAVLHLLRQERPEEARKIVGLDVANIERDCPPEVFAPYIRLLRGVAPEEAQLIEDCRAPWTERWWRLLTRNQIWHPVGLPQLGLTFHAGESFYTPVQGLRFIESAVRVLHMGPGDRIGHGLAAGLDVHRVLRSRGPGIRVPGAVLLNDCVWLLHMLAPHAGRFPAAVAKLQEWLTELSDVMYGAPQTLDVLWALHQIRAVLPQPQYLPPDGSPNPWYEERAYRRLWRQELFDLDCNKRAETLLKVPEEASTLGDAIVAAQDDVLKILANQRICVEVAPSSNLALGDMTSLEEHPFHRMVGYRSEQDRIRISINTDDPGPFATRLENEFALMYQVCNSRFGSGGETALEQLERARRDGLGTAFSCPGDPQGEGV